jgi:hypothetical protein
MKAPDAIVVVAVSLVLSLFTFDPAECFAGDYYLHTTTSDVLDYLAPTAATAKFKDSPAVNRTTYQPIGEWTAAPLVAPMHLESLGDLRVWIGLKNSDDQGTYFDLKAEVRKNGAVIASGETKNIQGVTRNPSLAKEVAVPFGVIPLNPFAAGDVLSIRILVKVADSGGHNNAVGLRLYYDSLSRATRFGATFGPLPAKLVVMSVNGGVNPVAGVPFPVVVQSQTASGIPANVAGATGIGLTLGTGSGNLGGMLIGTIAAGTSQVTIMGATYTKAESGVVITATRNSGDMLSSGDSVPFTVVPGAATALAFITQPGNVTTGNTIPGPPTLGVRDALGNAVTSSTAAVTIGIGVNPGSGVLSGTTTKSASGGIVNFNDLNINQAGLGYTLTAFSPGLMGTTSGAFNVTGGSGVSLTATPNTLTAGNPFTVTWGQIPSPTSTDWIGLYTPGSSSFSHLSYIYVSCTSSSNVVAASGSCQFNTSMFLFSGTYEFRLFPNNDYTPIATSNSVTINAATFPPSLTAAPATIPAGELATVTWSHIPNPASGDSIRLFSAGSTGPDYGWMYVSCSQTPNLSGEAGSCPFRIPATLAQGAYEFRFFPSGATTAIATSNVITIGAPLPPSKLALTVDQSPSAGAPGFSLIVEAQTASGNPANVSVDTAVSIGLKTGTGVLGGALNGTILAGSNRVTIGLTTYTKAESGVVLTATRSSGDALAAGDSSPFTVNPGQAARLVFVMQPGNTTTGSTIPGPPTVGVEDALGNRLSFPTIPIAMAIGTNPGGGSLSANVTVTTSSGVAFTGLSINQPGSGYTLTASSTGLEGATSNPFNIAVPVGGGTITGIITSVKGEMTISGALVEVFQGTALRGTTFSSSSGNYSITGLAAGSYTVRASYAGLVPQMVNNISVVDGSTTAVDLSLNFGIAVQSPVAGTTVNTSNVLVKGNFDRSVTPEAGITVNGYGALIDGDEFTALIPVDATVTVLTAALKNFAGTTLASDAIPVTVVAPTAETIVHLIPSPPGGLAPLIVGFSISTLAPVSQIVLDLDGDGSIDFQGASLAGNLFTYSQPGLFTPTVQITDNQGQTHTAVTFVHVLDQAALDAQLQVVWQGFKSALRAGEITQAVMFLHSGSRVAYQAKLAQFNALTLANIDQYMTTIQLVEVGFGGAQYEMIRIQDGQRVSFSVWFLVDQDGIWRIRRF